MGSSLGVFTLEQLFSILFLGVELDDLEIIDFLLFDFAKVPPFEVSDFDIYFLETSFSYFDLSNRVVADGNYSS